MVLHAAVADAGRDPASFAIAASLTVDPVGASGREALHTHKQSISGSTDEIVERLAAYVAAGAGHFMLTFPANTIPQLEEMMGWFSTEVRPRLLGKSSGQPAQEDA